MEKIDPLIYRITRATKNQHAEKLLQPGKFGSSPIHASLVGSGGRRTGCEIVAEIGGYQTKAYLLYSEKRQDIGSGVIRLLGIDSNQHRGFQDILIRNWSVSDMI